MMRSIQFIFTLLVVVALVPIVPDLPWFSGIEDIHRLSVFGGSFLAIVLAFRELHNERERRGNRRKTKDNEARITTIEIEKIEQNRLTAINALNPEVLADDSDAGYHWQNLQPSIEIEDYYHFLDRFKDSPYQEACLERTSELSRWKTTVDRADPIDISYFLMSRPYFALARHAREKLAEAIEKAPEKHEKAFWEAVERPLWTFFPVAYVIGFSFFAAPILIYEQTGAAILQPLLSSATEFVNIAIINIPESIAGDLTKQIGWVATNVVAICRALITGILSLAAYFGLYYSIIAIAWIVLEWQREQRNRLSHSIRVALDGRHKGLL